MDQATQQKIAQAKLLQEAADKLNQEIDKLLGSIATEAMAKGDINYIEELIKEMPDGFARSELQTWLKQNAHS
ncbi:hypothetical protein [Duganella sp. FT27W]|uniref:hypothetical protein n=1 Tax=Duganella sp. FT27W TaxID=2654636 RepID=UPI00128BCBAB|nr:hypothetical protein [Duganella sp. FT27W]MPQ56267.1 hypothetical protein [Duganella sp. FT27W]